MDFTTEPVALDFTEQTSIILDLDPTKMAKQLTDETGDDWTPEMVAAGLNRLQSEEGGLANAIRERIIDGFAEGELNTAPV